MGSIGTWIYWFFLRGYRRVSWDSYAKNMTKEERNRQIHHLCLEIGKFEESELLPASRNKLLALSKELLAALSM